MVANEKPTDLLGHTVAGHRPTADIGLPVWFRTGDVRAAPRPVDGNHGLPESYQICRTRRRNTRFRRPDFDGDATGQLAVAAGEPSSAGAAHCLSSCAARSARTAMAREKRPGNGENARRSQMASEYASNRAGLTRSSSAAASTCV